MRIDRKLNLVIPILDADGKKTVAYVHSTPISSEVFDTYFLPIAKTFSAIYSEGLGIVAGPRIADKMLRKVSTDLGVWDGPAGVQAGLVAEIHRLTNVIAVGKKGWETVPFDEAKERGILHADDAAEVNAALTFFTVISVMQKKAELPRVLGGAMKLWGSQIESLSCTEFMNSLRTSTAAENTGVTVAG